MKIFRCSTCEFSGSSNYCLERHFATKKHIYNIQLPDGDRDSKLKCRNCNKHYKENSGLLKHAKICKSIPVAISEIVEQKEEEKEVISNSGNLKESNTNHDILEEMEKMNEFSKESTMNQEKLKEMIEQMNSRIDKLTNDLKQNLQQVTTSTINNTNNNNNTTINNTFNMNIFLNESCNNAINFEDFIKNILFEHADSKLMIDSYVEGTCNIIQRNLEELPINKRPLHYLAGEDPHQQLMHIREGGEWNVGTELNWMKQIHADDDDLVDKKNPIYYALKEIDDEKLKYLGYYFNQDKEYKIQHARLHREISRPDFKEKVYQKLMKMITLDTDKLDGINIKSKIVMV